jgi:Na+/glutamate symporter
MNIKKIQDAVVITVSSAFFGFLGAGIIYAPPSQWLSNRDYANCDKFYEYLSNQHWKCSNIAKFNTRQRDTYIGLPMWAIGTAIAAVIITKKFKENDDA